MTLIVLLKKKNKLRCNIIHYPEVVNSLTKAQSTKRPKRVQVMARTERVMP